MKRIKPLILEFKTINDKTQKVSYYAEGRELGEGSQGFNRLLEQLKVLPAGSKVIIRHPLFVTCGGESISDIFPFRNNQSEFDEIVKQRNLNIVYEIMN